MLLIICSELLNFLFLSILEKKFNGINFLCTHFIAWLAEGHSPLSEPPPPPPMMLAHTPSMKIFP